MTTVSEYREKLLEEIALKANADTSNVQDEFLFYVIQILQDAEEFDDFTECYYEGLSKHKANMRIDGYSIDDTDGSCCIFITDYHGPFAEDSIRAEDIASLFRRIRHFVEEATKYELYRELEESTEAYEFAKNLFFEINNITKFRFYLLTDAYNKQRAKTIKDESVAGKTVEMNVWDINRIYDVINSQTQKESVEIIFSEMGVAGIPCVKAVEYHDIIADINISPKYDDESEDVDSIPENVITYSSYLAVVPGQILNDLYMTYGAKLLEGNVRSFLSVRGKVNKGIQNTIKNYPEMFFAYNNGIAATATEIDTEMTPDGPVITRIKDLQIVNGGQTTASIANTLLTAKNETIDISNLFVPMKISVLEHSMSERIIPKISEYSNSQNKVDDSDFFSNHPFHIRMEKLSRKIMAPAVNGNQFRQYWYYERTRGQYNQGKMKFPSKSSQLKQYEAKYPESQVIKMVDLAKYMEIFWGAPHIVSKGKQETVKLFAKQIKEQWRKSDTAFNNEYYKRVVSIAIIFKATDTIIQETSWYKEKHSYKANVVAYTMSTLFYLINNHSGYCLDFSKIWNQQQIYPELSEQLKILCSEIYEFITRDDRLTENVTQWCKQETCWERIKQNRWTITEKFIKTLISEKESIEQEKEAKETQKIDNEIDTLKYILGQGPQYWQKVLEWGLSRKILTNMESNILRMIINGRIPSERQAKVVIRAREHLVSEGMPLQF